MQSSIRATWLITFQSHDLLSMCKNSVSPPERKKFIQRARFATTYRQERESTLHCNDCMQLIS
eukprot:2720613-Amphidinium_carterae.5